MPVISVRVTKDVYEKLRKMASERGMSLYEYVRKVLEAHVSSEVSYPEVSYRDSASKLSPSKLLHEERKLSQSKLSELTSEQQKGADPDPGVCERLADVLRKLVDAVKRHEEKVSRLDERVALVELALFGIRDTGKAVQVHELDDVPEELRNKQPTDCSKGEGIEVCVYDAPS
jgi:Ribbon-helix-helix protein, copG family.